MTRKTALIVFLLAILAVSGMVVGQQAVRKSTIARHLAAAETAAAQGDYQGAVSSLEAALAAGADPAAIQVPLAEAQALAAFEELLRQVEEQIAARRYDLAFAILALIPTERPEYEQAHGLIMRAMTLGTIESLAEGWNVAKDPEAGRFVLTSAAAGTATLTIESIDFEAVGDAICRLEYESPSETRHPFPYTLALVSDEEFPATILSPGFLLVQGQHLWRPPADPEPAYPDAKGFVVGWSMNPSCTMAAAAFLQKALTDYEQPIVATFALDLASLESYLVSEYKIGKSFPYEWYNFYPIAFRWLDERSLTYRSLDGAKPREVTWRRP